MIRTSSCLIQTIWPGVCVCMVTSCSHLIQDAVVKHYQVSNEAEKSSIFNYLVGPLIRFTNLMQSVTKNDR